MSRKITKIKRKYSGTNSPNQEATHAQICSGFLENPPVIQRHEMNDLLIKTVKAECQLNIKADRCRS